MPRAAAPVATNAASQPAHIVSRRKSRRRGRRREIATGAASGIESLSCAVIRAGRRGTKIAPENTPLATQKFHQRRAVITETPACPAITASAGVARATDQ